MVRVVGRDLVAGKGSDALDRRPQLKAALKAAKQARCEVAVAKLDLSIMPAGITVPTFLRRSRPWLLTTAARGGLGSVT